MSDAHAAVPQEALSAALMRRFLEQRPLRTGSLIVTVFGDAIAPRGGKVWLGSLIDALAPLGISQRLVRTAVYRLVQDGLLTNEARGRRSFYALTESGRRTFDAATDRIYASGDAGWDGQWTLLLLQRLPSEARARLRKELSWLGFAALGNDLLAHPRPDADRLAARLATHAEGDAVVTMTGMLPAPPAGAALDLVRDAWDLPDLEHAYREFTALFQPLMDQVEHAAPLAPADAFYVRTFLIHEYRKVLLRDPGLPFELLPAQWPGHAAHELTRTLYRAVVWPAELFVGDAFQTETGNLPEPDQAFRLRFGGL